MPRASRTVAPLFRPFLICRMRDALKPSSALAVPWSELRTLSQLMGKNWFSRNSL